LGGSLETIKYHYNSLEDFLIHNPLSVDGQLDDGWEELFSVKGRELEATILFADISSFSARTLDLSSTETLIFVNHFFTWIFAEALREKRCIIDKYIGDEVMIIFSKEFGSTDPFLDAVQTARWIGEHDVFSFCPHIGIATGVVTIGFVGTPLKYNCSAFGKPVTLASRCASLKSNKNLGASSIFFPEEEWKGRIFEEVCPPEERRSDKGVEKLQRWELLPSRVEQMKNIPELEVREIVKVTLNIPMQSAEERAKESLITLQQEGMYRPLQHG
jgi:hypothetical protein